MLSFDNISRKRGHAVKPFKHDPLHLQLATLPLEQTEMCRTFNSRNCRKQSFLGQKHARVLKSRPSRKRKHSLGHWKHEFEAPVEAPTQQGSSMASDTSVETRACESASVPSPGTAAEEAMQRDYAERRADFRRNEEREMQERGLCGHGCLSRGQRDHSACNRNKVCRHYKRGCLLKTKCCGKYYPCRKCHDETEDHAMNRFETEFVACKTCGAEDVPLGESCSNCQVQFAKYSCMTCRFFDDAEERRVYHCDKCGICRVGAGLGIDNVHCEKCNTCVPIDVADTHKCTENALHRDCPVCLEDMAISSEQAVFMKCGHAMHMKCFTDHTRTSFTCPICIKAVADMTDWYRALDATVSQDVMPPAYAHRKQIVYCNDCEVTSKARFHFMYHKCQKCRGYKTRVVCEAKEDEKDEDDAVSGAKTDPRQ